MKFEDIQGNEIHIIGKGNKHNIVYLNTNATISLKEYIEERHDNNEYIFVTARKPYRQLSPRTIEHILNQLGKRINVKAYPHKVRHTTATYAVENGMPITDVQKMLGHSSINTTMIYATVSQDQVKKSHERYIT